LDSLVVHLFQDAPPPHPLWALLGQLFPALIALGAAYVGYLFATRQARDQRRHDHLRERIDLFYSPMVGALRQIRALSTLRTQLSAAADTAWRQQVDEQMAAATNRLELPMNLATSFAPFDRQLNYDNAQIRERILPLYERMVSLFTEHFWLAEASTQTHFEDLSGFVDLWHRHLSGSLPPRIATELQISEARLTPLYHDLNDQLARLSALVSAGRAA
jgi:hypothetical protein